MQHAIPLDQLGAKGKPMADAVQACVHCGFCLSACPTYKLTGQETDSPRGRILLMKHVLEGALAPEEAQPHVDTCLGCLACETACPSGVHYRDLISPFRERASSDAPRPFFERVKRTMLLQTLPYPGRFRFAAVSGRLAKPFKGMVPKPLRPMIDMLPGQLPKRESLPEVSPAVGEERGRVALLAGCAQRVLDPEINRATIDVLTRNGIAVVVPKSQACCGSLAWHIGEGDAARKTARKNLAAFELEGVDAVVTNAAGCGSGVQEYGLIFKGHNEQAAAEKLAGKAIDVTEYLARIGLRELPPPLSKPLRLAYQDACHLAHGQGVRSAPRQLLDTIDGLEVLDIPDTDLCCGSAGTYNIDHPEVAEDLGHRKAAAVRSVKPDLMASGNIGCLMQLRRYLDLETPRVPALHTMVIIARAYDGSLHG